MAVSEEAMSLISNVCALAKKLETDLPTLAAQPHLLRFSLEAISGMSNKAMKLLTFNPPQHPYSSSNTHMAFGNHQPPRSHCLQNWGAHASSAEMGAYDFHTLLQHKVGVGVEGGVELGLDMMGSNGSGAPEALALSGPGSELIGTDTPASSGGGVLQAECSKKR